MDAEETDDLAFDASASDVKSALESLTNVGTVNVTRDDLGSDLYAWSITFTEPITSAYVGNVDNFEDGDANVTSTGLSFPLLYVGGAESDAGLGLETLGTGGGINVTRVERGTLGPLSGQVKVYLSTNEPILLLPFSDQKRVACRNCRLPKSSYDCCDRQLSTHRTT